jgi:hypothetical protein
LLKLLPLVALAVDHGGYPNDLRRLVYLKVRQEVSNDHFMYALAVPGFFFGQRNTGWHRR